MKTPILNRDFTHPTDGWYNIEAKGDHPNKRADVVQVIDDEACLSIVNRFNSESAKPNFAGMLIDHEHFKHDEDKETTAYGWLTQLQNRADGLYAQIRWTDTGKKAVDGGDYRFFSTEYDAKDLQILNTGKPRRVRPLALDGLTLTNVNNNKGQKPITNRDDMKKENETETPAEEPQAGAGVAAMKASKAAHEASDAADTAPQHEKAAVAHRKAEKAQTAAGHDDTAEYHADMADTHDDTAKGIRDCKNREMASGSNKSPSGNQAGSGANTETQKMKSVLKALGLPEAASEADALAAVNKITNRNAELETATLESDLELYKNRFDPKQREFVKNMLVTNRAGAVEFLKAQPELKGKVAPDRLHNRNAAGTEAEGEAGGGESDEQALSMEREEAISDYRLKNRDSTYEEARNNVRNRKPELFGLAARNAN